MKNLSKALALAVLLLPGMAHADKWCSGANQHLWTFASGQVPLSYYCHNGSSDAPAQAWANDECQQAWGNLAVSNVIGGIIPTVQSFPDEAEFICSWTFQCRICVVGLLPHPLLDSRARLGPAEAGMAAAGVVKGQVLSIELHGAGGEEPFYLVDVVTDTEQVQVKVGAVTGDARVVKPEDDEGSCKP